MAIPNHCPACGVSLADSEHSSYSRVIGVEHPEIFDGVLYYRCPDCRARWHRFPRGHKLRAAAEKYVQPRRPK
jgi:hypothetical protein